MQFGNAYLDLIMSHGILAIARSCIAESEHAMEARMHDDGPRAGLKRIAESIATWIERGLLGGAEPKMMAIHLKAMLDATKFEPALFGAKPAFAAGDAVEGAVSAFLRAYGQKEARA